MIPLRDIIAELVITILISGSLFALTAVGFTLTYRVTKILHLAHGAVILASGYAFWWALECGASFVFAGIFTLAVALTLGIAIHFFLYERLRRRGRVATTMSLIATLALLMLIQNALLTLFGSATKSITFFEGEPFTVIGSVVMTRVQAFVISISLASIIATIFMFRRTRIGKSMRAVADNEIAATVIGIAASRIRLSALLYSSALGAIAGILYALEFNLDPFMGTEIAIRSFSRALIGGVGSIPGALLGSFIIETVEDIGAFFSSAGFKNVFSFSIVFLFLLFRPRGIFGERVRKEDL